MSADQKFTLLISGLGLIFLVMSTMLTFMWRAAVAQGRLASDISHILGEIHRIATDLDTHLQWHLDQGKRR